MEGAEPLLHGGIFGMERVVPTVEPSTPRELVLTATTAGNPMDSLSASLRASNFRLQSRQTATEGRSLPGWMGAIARLHHALKRSMRSQCRRMATRDGTKMAFRS